MSNTFRQVILVLSSFLLVCVLVSGMNEPESTLSLSRSLNTRIVGGTPAKLTRYPYFTYLDIIGNLVFNGAGSLIAPDIVLTAAHAFDEEVVGTISSVVAWVNRTSKNNDSQFGDRRLVVDRVVHPDYDSVTQFNDIAIIKLAAPVTGVPLIKLNRNASIPLLVQSVTAIGLGLISFDNYEFPETLMKVSMKPVSYDICNLHTGYDAVVNDAQMICAGGFDKDTCLGDSGGALLIPGTNNQNDVIVGITSFGTSGCGVPGAPGVYSRISYHAEWIDEQVCRLSSTPPTSCPPTSKPTKKPTKAPTRKPTRVPTRKPTRGPTRKPTRVPTRKPTRGPTRKPTRVPTRKPSRAPTPKTV